mgnify:CR=1 FL=1
MLPRGRQDAQDADQDPDDEEFQTAREGTDGDRVARVRGRRRDVAPRDGRGRNLVVLNWWWGRH